MSELRDKVALVTGASRGVGRGIAHELGIAGATVYVTGRSRDGEPTTDGLPGTIDETVRLVTEAGGHGIAVAAATGHVDRRPRLPGDDGLAHPPPRQRLAELIAPLSLDGRGFR